MRKTIILALLSTLALTGCGTRRSESLAYATDMAETGGTVHFTCNDSSTGTCLFRLDPGDGKTVSAAKGESVTISGAAVGSGYCAMVSANANCFHQELKAGHQIVRHQKVVRD